MSPSREVSTSALLRLLETGDPEQRCGAALVIGALTPTDRRVIPALGRLLETAPHPVQPYILDALGAFDDARTFKYIAPLLFAEGTLREQAVRVLEERGVAILDDLIAFAGRTTRTDTAALFRVLAHIPHERALDNLVSALEHANFDQARNITHALRRAGPRHGPAIRKHLVGRLVSTLDDLADRGENPTAEIGIIKTLAAVHDPRAIRPLLDRIEPGVLPALRQNALDALAEVVFPKNRVTVASRRLMELLVDDEHPSIVTKVLGILRGFDPFPLAKADLFRLASSQHEEVVCAALHELKRFSDRDSIARLLEAVLCDRPAIQAVAASALGRAVGATDAVMEAHEDPRFHRHRETLRTILEARSGELDAAAFRRRARKLINGEVPEQVLSGRVLALASIDRAALNKAVETQADRALRSAEPRRAIALLEPLVKNRLATPQGRYLLALAHIGHPGSTLVSGDEHHDRAMQLLSPLARVTTMDLKKRLLGEDRVSADALHAIAGHMSRRAETEKKIAEVLRARLSG